eukprot:2444504-Lingulodinium_polyedra.AAC.1
MLDNAPWGALVPIIGGSPCQQFAQAGRYQGRRGLAGRDSILFYAIPVIARIVADARPDVLVHVLCENA